ncbi:hypothetical protein BRW65_04670 [Mycobacterium paraffinicum]|uniref:Uncharacterized protein n=1 Tax=Mycobacterium paraffinicum TaxID=53378 RepID=A0A1Q4HZG9_9MYCO|nr:hypothetical protein BRW65_04670 [Mycobacterium paraffinicum]
MIQVDHDATHDTGRSEDDLSQWRSQARRSRARRVATIWPVAIESAAQPGAAGRHHLASGDRKRGAAGRGGSPPLGY